MTLRAVTASAAGIAVATLLVTLLVTGNSPMPRPEPTAAAAQGAMKSGESEAGGVPGPEKRRAMRILDNGCTYNPRGIPSCGTLLGAAYGSNSDPAPWERQMGHRLGVHRTYFDGSEVDEAVAQARTDLRPPADPVDQLQAAPLLGCDGGRSGRRLGPGPVAPARTAATAPSGSRSTTSPRATATSGTGRPCRPGWRRSCARPRPTSPSRSSSAAGTSSTARTSTACPSLWPAHDDRPGRLRRLQQVRRGQERSAGSPATRSSSTTTSPSSSSSPEAHDVAWGLAETGSHRPLGAGTDPLFVQHLYNAVSSNGGVAISLLQQHHQQHRSVAPGRRQVRRLRGHAARDPHPLTGRSLSC